MIGMGKDRQLVRDTDQPHIHDVANDDLES